MEFKVYIPKEGAVLENLGTVAEVVGVGGGIRFVSEKNLTGSIVTDFNGKERLNNVTIVMLKADGTSATINCSVPVSKAIRASLKEKSRKELLGALAQLTVVKNPAGIESISAPAGTVGEIFKMEELTKEVATYQELVAW